MNTDRRRDVDLLIEEFWKKGYLTLYRKFGTYLPEPSNIGGFEVDVIAKQKDNFAIGVTFNDQDFNDTLMIKNKLSYLAQRQIRGTNKRVQLFVGVSLLNLKYAKALLDELDPETRKNIKLFEITEKPNLSIRKESRAQKVLFS
ncbi:MAG: hypothetical protein IPJ23_10050 [Ignavibacteriales bacterium]|nr:hypothetical protein [Ignavibacteriales bacterium]